MDVGSSNGANQRAGEIAGDVRRRQMFGTSRSGPEDDSGESGAVRPERIASGRSAEVALSDEARRLHADRGLAESRAAEARSRRAPSEAQQAHRQERDRALEERAARELEPPERESAMEMPKAPQIAVRAGPLSTEEFSAGTGAVAAAERALAESLNGRARLVNVEKVLVEADRAASPEQASSDGNRVDPERLLGNGEPADLPVHNASADRSAQRGETAHAQGAPEPRPNPVRDAVADTNRTDAAQQRAQTERDRIERVDRPDDHASAAALAPQSGGVSAGTPSAGAESAAAENTERNSTANETVDRAFSQAGVVEASAQDQLASRFLGNLPAPEPGPEPAPREVIGQRNRG